MLFIIIIATLIAGNNNVDAAAPNTATFTWTPDSHGYYNNFGSRYFYGEEKTGDALCVQAGVGVAGAGSEYKFVRYTGSTSYTNVNEEAENLKFDLTKVEDENPIQVEEQHPDGIAMKKLSTFKFKCSSTEAELKFYAYNYNKKTVYCDVWSNSNNSGIENNGSGNYKIKKEYKNKEIEFSIYVKEEDYKKRNCVY